MSTQPKVTPKRPGQRHPRLDSLNNPQPRPPPQAQQLGPDVCPNPECQSTNSEVEDHKVICSDCGAVIREHDMVTDVQYGLSSSGNHVVHGHHVGADQAYVRNGDVFDRNKALTSIEVTNVTGKVVLSRPRRWHTDTRDRTAVYDSNRFSTGRQRCPLGVRHASLQAGLRYEFYPGSTNQKCGGGLFVYCLPYTKGQSQCLHAH